jgi:hypothetical protein
MERIVLYHTKKWVQLFLNKSHKDTVTPSTAPQLLSQIRINHLSSMNVEFSVEVLCHVHFSKSFVVLLSLRCSMLTARGSHLNHIYLATSSVTHLSTKLQVSHCVIFPTSLLSFITLSLSFRHCSLLINAFILFENETKQSVRIFFSVRVY